MSMHFWIKRFVIALLLAFGVIVLGQLVQARGFEHALTEGAIWAPITATVYLAAVWVHWRKGRRCRICAVPDAHEQSASRAASSGLERDRQADPRGLR